MSSTSLRALAASLSDSSEPGCAPLDSASVTNTAAPSLGNIGQASPALTTFTPLTQTDWIGLDASILSAADSHASPSPSPESRERKRTTVTSGRKCAALLHSQDPLGSFAKTLLASSRWHSTMCSLIWKVSATPRGRLLFRLRVSELHTEETAFGLWPTPVANDDNKSPEAHLAMKARMKGGPRYKPTSLQVMVKGVERGLWPMPTARDWRSGKASEATHKRNSRPLSEQIGGQLSPTWVEWLMGFPAGWTALEPSEMPSSRKLSKKSAEQSCSAAS